MTDFPRYTTPGIDTVFAAIDAQLVPRAGEYTGTRLPDGTGMTDCLEWMHHSAQMREDAIVHGTLTWAHVLEAALAQAFTYTDTEELRDGLLTVVTLAVSWIQSLDRRLGVGADYVPADKRPQMWAEMAAKLAAAGYSEERIAAELAVDEATIARLTGGGESR